MRATGSPSTAPPATSMRGQIATVAATENRRPASSFMGWADAARQLKVFTNADNPNDAQNAVNMGAEGIGLCRTEHMFFAADRIKAVREMICAAHCGGPQEGPGQG